MSWQIIVVLGLIVLMFLDDFRDSMFDHQERMAEIKSRDRLYQDAEYEVIERKRP